MKRVLLLAVVATVAVGIGSGFAATLAVGTDHLWAGTQSLTKGTCTLSGTAQSTDTYVNQASSNTSYGGGTTMLVQPDSGSQKQSMVVFDLSKCPVSIPTSGGADSATLTVTITNTPKRTRTLTVAPITSSWSGSTTWNTRPSAGSSTATFATGTTNGVSVNIPVTIDVDGFIKGTANYGWRISDGGSSAAQDTTTLATSNATSGRPTLTINYEK